METTRSTIPGTTTDKERALQLPVREAASGCDAAAVATGECEATANKSTWDEDTTFILQVESGPACGIATAGRMNLPLPLHDAAITIRATAAQGASSRDDHTIGVCSDSAGHNETDTATAVSTAVVGEAAGLLACSGGHNAPTIAGGRVVMTVRGSGGHASGIGEGTASIPEALDGEFLTVVIKVTAGSAEGAYAMYADGIGSANGEEGTNLALKIGERHDLLILKASGAATFTEYYREWLENLTDEQLRDMVIEEIWINGEKTPEWLGSRSMNWFWDFLDKYNDITGHGVFPGYAHFMGDADIAGLAAGFLDVPDEGPAALSLDAFLARLDMPGGTDGERLMLIPQTDTL